MIERLTVTPRTRYEFGCLPPEQMSRVRISALTFTGTRYASDEFELLFEATVDGRRRQVGALAEYDARLGVQFPHPLTEAGQTLGTPELDLQVRDCGAEILALIDATDAWRAYQRRLRDPAGRK